VDDTTLAYDTTYCDAFKKRWQRLHGKVVGEDQFKNPDPSIASQITRFNQLSTKPDFIMLCSYTPGGASAIRQMRSAGIKTAILMNVGMAGDYWLKSVPGLENAWQDGYASWSGDDPIAKVNQLSARWRAKYHTGVPLPHAFMGYETMQLVAAAIKTAG